MGSDKPHIIQQKTLEDYSNLAIETIELSPKSLDVQYDIHEHNSSQG